MYEAMVQQAFFYRYHFLINQPHREKIEIVISCSLLSKIHSKTKLKLKKLK